MCGINIDCDLNTTIEIHFALKLAYENTGWSEVTSEGHWVRKMLCYMLCTYIIVCSFLSWLLEAQTLSYSWPLLFSSLGGIGMDFEGNLLYFILVNQCWHTYLFLCRFWGFTIHCIIYVVSIVKSMCAVEPIHYLWTLINVFLLFYSIWHDTDSISS